MRRSLDFLSANLTEGLWHVTSPERYTQIVQDQALLPEPKLADHERWGTSQGADMYPLVRHLGGVSLFDFRQFDPHEYELRYPLSNWSEFVPCPSKWDSAIWLEIDVASVSANLISAAALIEIWEARGLHRRRVMPMIEVAHIGPISTAQIKREVHWVRPTAE